MTVHLQTFQIREPKDFDKAFAAVSSSRIEAIVVLSSPLMFFSAKRIADFAVKSRLPAISLFDAFPEAGGLMSYGPIFTDVYQRLGVQTGKILRGSKPGSLPVERPTRFRLVINLRTARALGLTIPQPLLLRADEVIR